MPAPLRNGVSRETAVDCDLTVNFTDCRSERRRRRRGNRSASKPSDMKIASRRRWSSGGRPTLFLEGFGEEPGRSHDELAPRLLELWIELW